MWFLKSKEGEVHYLHPGIHIVGRRDCNLRLAGDASISRKHAQIEVTHPPENWGNPFQRPVVHLTDTKSKYGTTLHSENGTENMTDVAKNLSEGDEILFGVQENKWKVCFDPLVIVMSMLSRAEKQSVKSEVSKLGGHIITAWLPQTTHLTMSSITMTVKAISALAYAKPIVAPSYWISFNKAVTTKTPLPKYEDFIPPLNETGINKNEVSFLINLNRRTIFKGKTFYFFSQNQYKEHGCLVEAAGGKSEIIEGDAVNNMREFLRPNIVVMHFWLAGNSQNTQNSQIPSSFSELSGFLKVNGKRAVPSSEIGLAILHCSTEKFCNPDFSFSSILLGNSENSTNKHLQGRILATETEELSQVVAPNSGLIIPDSGTESVLKPESHYTSQVFEEDSNTELPQRTMDDQSQEDSSEQWIPGNKSHTTKRIRVVDESDEEVEFVPPSKKPVQTKTSADKNTRGRRGHGSGSSFESHFEVSRVTQTQEDDDMEDLFANVQDSDSKTRTSVTVFQEEEDLFKEFEDNLPKQQRQDEIHEVDSSLHSKRELSFDDESGPPTKQLKTMDLADSKLPPASVPQNSSRQTQEEAEFISVLNTTGNNAVPTSCNVTVVVKSLMVTKDLNTSSVSSVSSVCENGKNFKRFKKIQPMVTSIIPQIIGGDDLCIYRNTTHAFHDFALQDSDEEKDDQPDSLWQEVTRTKPTKISLWAKKR